MNPKKPNENRFLKFMASAKGRKFTFVATVTASLATFGVNYLPHSFLTFKHREFVSSYSEGSERAVSDTINARFELAKDMLKVIDFDAKFMKPFVVSGFDLYHIGSTNSKYGSLVGIPINYTYTSTKDIDKASMMIRGKPIDWNSKGGLLLEDSLVLKEDEQIFGMAREILQLQSNQVLWNSLVPPAAISMYYAASSTLNSKMRLFYRPLSFRASLYFIVGSFVYGLYSFATDYKQVKVDGDADEQLATIGRGVVDAGARFYDKLLKKNMAVRELTDDDEYTALGNENSLLRMKRLPLTVSKTFFEMRLKEIDAEAGKSEEAPVKASA